MSKKTQPEEYECPNCGGVMLAVHPDRYCAECIHEGRV